MPMPIGGPPRTTPSPVPGPQARPAPVAALMANLAGVTNVDNRSTGQAPPGLPSILTPTAGPTSLAQHWHALSQRTFTDAQALAPPPTKYARMAGLPTPFGLPAPGALDQASQRGLEVLVGLISSNSHWNSTAGDIAPQFIPRLNHWPDGRSLEIHDSRMPVQSYGVLQPGQTPVQIYREGDHYEALVQGQRQDVPGDGNCFYHALEAAMGPRDAAAFHPVLGNAALQMRMDLAAYVQGHGREVAQWADLPRLGNRYGAAVGASGPDLPDLLKGTPAVQGRTKIQREGLPTTPVTGRLLQELSALGAEGIRRAGGLGALANERGVGYNSLRTLIHGDGSLTTRGQAKIHREVLALPTTPVTVRLLQELSALGAEGIRRAGGLAALANERGVEYNSLRTLIHDDGSLTARGQAKIQREGGLHSLGTA